MSKKRRKNLLLDDHALSRAEEYCSTHRTTLSRLVEDYLATLAPLLERSYQPKSRIVLELRNVAVVNDREAEIQRDFLERHRRRRGKNADGT